MLWTVRGEVKGRATSRSPQPISPETGGGGVRREGGEWMGQP